MDALAPPPPVDEPAASSAPPDIRVHTRFAVPASEPVRPAPHWRKRLQRVRSPMLLVLLPTLLVAGYEYLIAADQFESEAHFLVRTAQPSGSSGGGLGQMLGLGAAPSEAEGHGIVDYLLSHDALAAIRKTIDVTGVFRRPEADFASRLWDASPAPETLLRYYRNKVDARQDSRSGIIELHVRAFRPKDAHQIAETLLQLGEARINGFNKRALDDGLAVASEQLAEAEIGVAAAQHALTAFRQRNRDIDPERSSTAQISLAAELEQELARRRAHLAGVGTAISTTSPQYVALAAQVHALERQTSAAHARLAGSERAMAPGLGTYEELRLRQDFAAKRYAAAANALGSAREQAIKQQLFVVRVVEPNLPARALYPKRLKTVVTVFFGLLLTYAVGWLILAGVREHAA